MKKLILSVGDYRTEVALVEDSKLAELQIYDKNVQDLVGNFYRARIVDVVENLKAFFVDIGLEKKAFLTLEKIKLDKKLSIGDEILVQVNKNPRGEKGATLTLDYSLASKNLVLLPNSKTLSISRKIENEKDRERIRGIFSNLKEIGLIVRTSAVNIDEFLLKKEYDELLQKWQEIEKNYLKAKKNKLVYSNNSMIEKLFREFFNEDIEELIVDDKNIFEEIKSYIAKERLYDLERKISRYFKEEDIFDFYGINVDIENALRKKVWLDSGAYIVIEKTEALISIDVNSGRNLEEKDLRDTILKTNLEAAVEIPRQLRLRNLAGIIIIDFINMNLEADRKKVLKVFEENLKKDREKVEIVNFSKLDLLQLTRKRQGNDLAFYYQKICPHCEGTGLIISREKAILNILKELKEIKNERDIKKIEIKTSKEMFEELKNNFMIYIEKILENTDKKIIFLEEKSYIDNRYEIILSK